MEDIEIRDEVEGFQEKTLSMTEIILRHIRKISDLSCKEFTGGYWDKKPVKTSGGIMFMETYHEDVRQAYCNAVDFLVDIIYPKSDQLLKDYFKDFEDFKEKITKEDKVEVSEMDIKQKIALKRQTFRQINLMFERTNFFSGINVSEE
jgi:hypothetical protein